MRRLVIALVVLLAACSTEPDVDWSEHAPGLQAQIDRMAADGDCAGLEREREAASESRLKRYVYETMRETDCY